MANWHYYTENREKIGPVTGRELKQLVMQGTITRETFVEDPNGRTGLAKAVNGLVFPEMAEPEPVLSIEPDTFTAASSSFVQPAAQTVPVPPTAPKQLFCTNCGNSIAEQAVACLSCGARPTGHKKFCRQCGVGLNPEQVICIKCGAGLTGGVGVGGAMANLMSAFQTSGGAVGSPSTVSSKTLNLYFMVCWISGAVGVVLMLPFLGISVVVQLGGGVHETRQAEFFATMLPLMILFYIGYIGLITATVSFCMLHYQLWKLIPKEIARTTPGKAVGFLFIPFFNLYWVFISYLGLSKNMNETLRQRGIQYQANESLALAACALTIAGSIIPLVSGSTIVGVIIDFVLMGAAAVVAILFYKSVKDGAIALLEQGGQ